MKLGTKIFAIKSYRDYEISVLNDKTNTVSASIDLALKAIEEKQEKTIPNLERNIDFLQKEQTTKNEFVKTIMDTQKDLVNTLSHIHEKASTQNLHIKIKHCCCQESQQPSPQNHKKATKTFSLQPKSK